MEPAPYPMDLAPAMPVETAIQAPDLRLLWDRILASWTSFGAQDPYWSVMTDPRWRMENMTGEEALHAFYESGAPDLFRLERWFERNGLALPTDGVCAEYGCGVGRVTRRLARRFRQVRAFDISRTHLEAARARLESEGIGNVEYVLVRSPEDLKALAGCDLFFSLIVLQHNPPPIIGHILDQALAGLNGGGFAFFQVPVWRGGYRFSVAEYLAALDAPAEMELHCMPQNAVFAIAAQHGCEPIDVQPDGCVGRGWVSNAFLLRKRGG